MCAHTFDQINAVPCGNGFDHQHIGQQIKPLAGLHVARQIALSLYDKSERSVFTHDASDDTRHVLCNRQNAAACVETD